MNFDKIYEYRFKNVSAFRKQIVWKEISNFIYLKLNKPDKIIDPASGFCEFINNVPSSEKWAVVLNESFLKNYANSNIKIIANDFLKSDLPENYFDAVFVSNFLEHLNNHIEVSNFLKKVHKILKNKGKIAIIGLNFKFAYKEYFDFADHNLILTELSVAEHLYGAGFNILKIYPAFLPLSFRSNSFLPINKLIIKTYLYMPFIWKILGKQFLIIAEK